MMLQECIIIKCFLKLKTKNYKSDMINIIKITTICTLLLFTLNIKSQDLIIYNNKKDTVKCNIIKDNRKYIEYQINNDTNVYIMNYDQYDFYIDNNDTVRNKNLQKEKVQKSEEDYKKDKKTFIVKYPLFSAGTGIGLDYGGFGLRVTSLSTKHLSIFIGLGYNSLNMGVNLGGLIRFLPSRMFCPTFCGMYGYNAMIVIAGDKNITETYYGPSFGVGFELRSKKLKNYLSFGLIMPVRSQNYEDDMNAIRRNPNATITKEPADAIITLGYHVII